MSNGEIELLESLRQRDRKQWLCAVLMSILISGIISFFWNVSVIAELSRLEQLIRENKCKCTSEQPKQIHSQNVTVSSPPLVDPNVMAAELKRRHEARHNGNDVRRIGGAAGDSPNELGNGSSN